MRILIVATWGFPGRWKKVAYVPPIPPSDVKGWRKLREWRRGGGDAVSAHSATAALACELAKEGHEVEAAVFGLDTLAAPPMPSCVQGDEICSELAERLGRCGCVDPGAGYGVILSRAREILDMYAEAYMREVGGCGKGVGIKTFILPGTGEFRCGLSREGLLYEFEGSPLNAYALMRLEILEELRRSGGGFDAVVLDISHGINYLPVLAREATMKAVETYSALYSKAVGLAVVNSDPPPPNPPPGRKYRIHVVETRSISAGILRVLASRVNAINPKSSPFRGLYYVVQDSLPRVASELRKSLTEKAKDLKGLLIASAVAYDYGLMLYLLTNLIEGKVPGYCEINDLIGRIRTAAHYREIMTGASSLKASQYFEIQPEAIDLIELLHLTSRLQQEVKESGVLIGGGGRMFSLDSLTKIAQKIGISGVAKTILENEVDSIRELVKIAERARASLEEPKIYSSLIDLANTSLKDAFGKKQEERGGVPSLLEDLNKRCREGGCSCTPDKRNFLAHAGLSREVTQVMKHEGKIYVGYRRECIDKIEKLIEKLI